MRSFAVYPQSSSPLPPSLFFISNTKLASSRLRHGSLLQMHRHLTVTSCSFHERFSTADSAHLSIDSSSFECLCADFSHGGPARSVRHSLPVCRSYGDAHRQSSSNLRGNDGYDTEPATGSKSYHYSETYDRESPPIGNGYVASQISEKEPPSTHKRLGVREILDRLPSSVSSNRDSVSFNRDSLASNTFRDLNRFRRVSPPLPSFRDVTRVRGEYSGSISYGRPRSYARDYPARIDRLQEVVSRSYGGHSKELSLEHTKPNGNGDTSRGFMNSPFKKATVSVFWDLDNKPPKVSPYHTALYLRHAASQFGAVVDMVAYANRHAFNHVPEWVREQRRDRKQLDVLEQRGLVQPEKPYVCSLCGRKCKTNLLLKKHFKQLHEREHHKRMSRLNSLKGKKKRKYREAMLPKTQRYKEAASPILVPKVGYGLESDLRRAGIFVRTVQHKPQAADVELKRQMADSINKGVNCICLVSDDTDFASMLADARALDLHTIVFGESRSLKRYADFWFSWDDVSQGMPTEDFQEAIRAWSLHHGSARQRDLEILAQLHNSDDTDVEHKIFGECVPGGRSGFSAFTEEDPSMLEDVDGSLTDDDDEDDDADWSFEDEEELDDEWENVDELDALS